ncbi:MAG: biotin/lipoyl-binding protein [Negativicutes bacterium]|nr:biotin/lipoyl-binding protein [Negativicutes bacterium]MDR3592638.1 biotin/lipoyl-binding protein [Negativicutes bacterium]
MLRVRSIIVMVLVFLVFAVAWVAANGAAVDQKGVLSGRVLANGLAVPGAAVREGDVLVFVDTITTPVPAVRANVDGKVTEVLVKPGDMIRTGDVLVRIEPARK